MPLVNFTQSESDALAAARAGGNRLARAEQIKTLLTNTRRDILQTASAIGTDLSGGKHVAVAADYARRQGVALQSVLAKLDPANTDHQDAAGVYGWSALQLDVVHRQLVAAATLLANTAEDGSEVAADIAVIVAEIPVPTSLLW